MICCPLPYRHSPRQRGFAIRHRSRGKNHTLRAGRAEDLSIYCFSCGSPAYSLHSIPLCLQKCSHYDTISSSSSQAGPNSVLFCCGCFACSYPEDVVYIRPFQRAQCTHRHHYDNYTCTQPYGFVWVCHIYFRLEKTLKPLQFIIIYNRVITNCVRCGVVSQANVFSATDSLLTRN